ncbi:MAG: glycosyltransferase family 9 protein [Thermodesulfobacteriota bacterium]
MDDGKILIIHLSRLGDMVQSLPALKLLKEERPHSVITYLGVEDFCRILSDVPWIDKLVTLPWQEIGSIVGELSEGSLGALDRLWNRVPELAEEYDLLVNLTHNWGSSYLSGRVRARQKRGRVFSDKDEIVVSGKWGKYLFAMTRNQKDNLLNLVDIYMGMAGVRNRPAGQFLPTDPELDQRCASQLSDLGVRGGKLSVGFQLGASKPGKTWPVENFIKLGELLFRRLGAQLVLFGSERDLALADRFHEQATYPFTSLIGKTRLSELGSFFKGIDLLIGNDTGPIHIAAAVGTKVVGIFVSTAYFGVTGPYGAGHVAVQSNYPCAPCLSSTACYYPLCRENIKPETVEQGVRLCLGLDEEIAAAGPEAGLYKSSFHTDGTLRYRLISPNTDGFLPWLRSLHYLKASVSQSLWNDWLGLRSDSVDVEVKGKDLRTEEILAAIKKACSSYKKIYEDGRTLCRKIIDQFQRDKPDIPLVQVMIGSLRQIEERVRDLECPLSILKEMHEYYMAEMEPCNFPELAHKFLEKYTALRDIITSFEITLKKYNISNQEIRKERV